MHQVENGACLFWPGVSQISLLVGGALSSGEIAASAEVQVLAASLEFRPALLPHEVVGRSAGDGYPPRAASGEPTGGDAVGGDECFGRRVETGVGLRLDRFQIATEPFKPTQSKPGPNRCCLQIVFPCASPSFPSN